ncbi:MAG: fibronectin type III domain-containing protein [Solirubrobacteraceae bacterium]
MGRHQKRERRLAKRGPAGKRAAALRHMKRHARSRRRVCLKRFGRRPGRVTALTARAASATSIKLTFNAPGTDGRRGPAARSYLVKQSLRPIAGARSFAQAKTLCDGACRFSVTQIGAKVTLSITDLLPSTTYRYALAARDNLTGRLGPRSKTARAKTS